MAVRDGWLAYLVHDSGLQSCEVDRGQVLIRASSHHNPMRMYGHTHHRIRASYVITGTPSVYVTAAQPVWRPLALDPRDA